MAASLSVELCGKLADLAGHAIAVPVPDAGWTAGELLAAIAIAHAALGPLIAAGKVRVCINETMARPADPVRPGDLVALFPPVSGG